MCTYLAAFPAGLPHAFIARYTRPGDVVLDPFCGRGTTPLQACAEGRIGVGNDLSPLAHLLTSAKLDPPQPEELLDRLEQLRGQWAPGRSGRSTPYVPPEVAIAFHPKTLDQVLYLRARLDPARRADRFLAATSAGILHGRGTFFLSALMPNTFALPPAYARRYAAASHFVPEERDLFDALRARVHRLLRDSAPQARGIALLGDARDAGTRAHRALGERSLPARARLVVTSPPYLRVVRYGASNWLRLWFLGLDPTALDARLDHAHRPDAWVRFMGEVLGNLRQAISDDAVVVLVLGEVESDGGHRLRRGIDLAALAWEGAAQPNGYHLAGIATDPIAAQRKSTRIWGDEAGRATRVDHLLVIAPTELGRRRALASAPIPVSWTWGHSACRGGSPRDPGSPRSGEPVQTG